ncbi:hypothetical protein ACSMXM_01230 [Pacificimonas sp. ICDLI1SI03]
MTNVHALPVPARAFRAAPGRGTTPTEGRETPATLFQRLTQAADGTGGIGQRTISFGAIKMDLLGDQRVPGTPKCSTAKAVRYIEGLCAHEGFPLPLPRLVRGGGEARLTTRDVHHTSRWPRDAYEAWLARFRDGGDPGGATAAAPPAATPQDTAALAEGERRLAERLAG